MQPARPALRRSLRQLVLVGKAQPVQRGVTVCGTVLPHMEAIESLSIVIPVFNSEESLPSLLESLARELPTLAREHEVILVNDGSRDRSSEVARALQSQYPFVR